MAGKLEKAQLMQVHQADLIAARQEGPRLIAKLMNQEQNIFAKNLQETKYIVDNPKLQLPREIRTLSYIRKEVAATKTFNIVEKDIELNDRVDMLLKCRKLQTDRRKE